jgi:TetR/AcrR family transcriptional regulator, regulator of cefoperazone and chloramphenicol sensitivity
MKKQRIDGLETRQRLLDAAGMVFAEKGFWETTNADICGKASVNTASVNYHFGSKEELYVEAWKYSFDKSLKKHPPDGGISPEAPAEKRLKGRILSFMQRIIDPETYEFNIMHKEMACPTGLLNKIVHSSIQSQHDGLKSIVSEIMGTGAREQDINFCCMNVIDMCFGVIHYLHHGMMLKKKRKFKKVISEKDIEVYADHIVRFALAGIRGIRKDGAKKILKQKKISKNKKARIRSK